MKKFKIYILLILGVLHFSVLNAQVGDTSENDIIEGKIRLKFKQESFNSTIALKVTENKKSSKKVGLQSVDDVSTLIGISRIKRLFPFSPKFEAKHREYGLNLWYEVEFDSNKSAKDVIRQYETLAEIEIVKPIYKKTRIDSNKEPVVFKPQSEKKLSTYNSTAILDTNDPNLIDQWHYNNDGRFGEFGSDIELFEAWNTTTGSSNIIVAVVDQGIDFNHEDLKDNMWINEAEMNGEEGVDDDQNGYIDDFYGTNFNIPGAITPGDHGTHVAGTVGAVSNNGIGVAGVAGGDGSGNGVRLMSTQVFDARNNNGGNFAEAIVYGADNGAVISQNSWGYNRPDYYEPEVLEAIRYFVAEAGQYPDSPMKGGILFFAAGNEGVETSRYPGKFDEVVAVSASGPTGLPAPYTNFGDWVDISAPGGDSTNFGDEGGVLSTLTDNRYGYIEGTSMACPHVSGVAALVLSKIGNESLTPDDLRRIILNSTTPFRFQHNSKYGKGILNAAKALVDDKRIPPNAITDLRASETFHSEVRLAWTVPDDEDGFSPSYYYLALGEEPITATNFENQGLFLIDNNKESGETFDLNLNGLIKETDYWFAIKTFDQFDNISEISNILKVTTSSEPHFMESTKSIDLTIDVTDNPLANVPLEFSNISDGIIYWQSLISNETYFTEVAESSSTALKINNKSKKSKLASKQEDLGTSFDAVKYLTDTELAGSSLSSFEHWKTDSPDYVAGLSYEDGAGPAYLAGTGNSNAGLIFATRFDIPYDFSFNLTHLEVALLPETKDYPITVEIKKGSRNDMTQAETVYTQEYYPDAINEFKYYRIPIYNPQKFQDNETFWVVLHFPKEMLNPLVMQFGGGDFNDRFIVSRDNGRTYFEAVNLMFRPTIPMLRAYSTGENGSFVFLNPNNGEIQEKSSQNVNVTVDANTLTNGHHLASIGILTNDVHKPLVNIELKLKVEGQVASVENTTLHEYEIFTDIDNDLELTIENTGYSDFEVYGYAVQNAGNTEIYADTLTVIPAGLGKVPFNFTSANEGVLNDKILLQTNLGELPFSLRLISEKSPSMAVSLSSNNIDVNYGDKESVVLTIANYTNGAALEYDLNHYSLASMGSGLLDKKVNYSISSSLAPGGPSANTWDDISGFGTYFYEDEISSNIPLGMKFPFFDQLLENINFSLRGNIDIFNYRAMTPLIIEGEPLNIEALIYHAFGNRVVFTLHCDLKRNGAKGYTSYGETVEFQIVLFKDGTVEYRYKDVSDLGTERDFKIFMQGIENDDSLVFRDYGDALQINNGLVVRFSPDRVISMISETSKLEGVVLSGNSDVVNLNINPKAYGFTSGSYKDTIVIYNNTAAKFIDIPLVVNVSGTPEIIVKDSLNFKDPVFIGESATQYLKIENKGAEAINLVSATLGVSQFTVDNSLFPLEVEATSNIMLPVNFNSTSADNFIDQISISFQDGAVYHAIVTAEGLEAEEDPQFSHNLALPISVNINGGEKTSIPFSVSSTANAVGLEYLFKNSKYAAVSNNLLGKAIGENNKKANADYGYTWALSDSLKIFHKWDALDQNEGLLKMAENEYKSIELPFEFPFYGEYYNTIWVSTNGYISVNEPKNEPSNLEFNTEDEFTGVIAPFWTQLKTNDNGVGVNYRLQNNTLIVQWSELTSQNPSSNPGTLTFQVEINADGYIKFHYDEIDTWGGALKYGIKSPDGTEYLEEPRSIILRWANIKDYTSMIIAPPQHGVIDAQQKDDFNLTVSAENIFYPGVYQDTLMLVTNSKNQKLLEIPVELNVTSTSVLTVKDTLSWSEIVFNDDLILHKTIQVSNKGYDILEITSIDADGLENLTLYDETGNKIIRNSSGELLVPINLNPWETYSVSVEIPVSKKENKNGKIYFSGNFPSKETIVTANIVDSPIFKWDVEDQDYRLTNVEKEVYTFKIENQGETTLNYNLIPATVPYVAPTPTEAYLSDEIGEYDFDDRVTVDSLALDFKEVGDGVFTPFVSGANLAFSNHFTAPEGGFSLTHVKIYTYLDKIEEFVTLMVYKGGDLPQDGEKLYEQQFVINKSVDQEWIYFPLEQPFLIPEGEDFYIIITHPVSYKYLGIDNSDDENQLKHTFSGVYNGTESYSWWTHADRNEKWLWKIRALTASGKNQWLTLDTKEGAIPAGANVAINATINPEIAGKGTHKGKILVKSNDINYSKDEVGITLNVNGAPEFKFYPNIYNDTLHIVETELKVFNYLFEDIEDDDITILIDDTIKGIEYELTQTGENIAQVSVNTDYESEGYYGIPVKLKDAVGNVINDTIAIQVLEKNRAPIFNTKYEVITLNMASGNKAMTINPFDMFTDPDGHGIQVLAGNYNPEIVDMALGSSFINLNPLQVGTGQLVFGADDGKENGFVIYLVNVNVIDNSESGTGVPNSVVDKVNFDDLEIPAIFTPNPVVNNFAKLYYKLEEQTNVNIQLYDSFGQLKYETNKSDVSAGEYVERISFEKLTPGFYICILNAKDKINKSFKIIVK